MEAAQAGNPIGEMQAPLTPPTPVVQSSRAEVLGSRSHSINVTALLKA